MNTTKPTKLCRYIQSLQLYDESKQAIRRLLTSCEKNKCYLSSNDSVIISVDNFHNGMDLRVKLTREKFEELNDHLFKRTIDIVEQVLVDAKLNKSDIDDIVLVGGSTRIPRVQEMLKDLFDNKPLNYSVNTDEAVAIGAAIQAAILNGNEVQELRHLNIGEVAPMSLGIKDKNGYMSTIIHRNSKVPNRYHKIYETSYDYQREFEIEIYEGEEQMAVDNKLLGTFTLSNIPSGLAGEQKIDVVFDITDEGILHVSAKCESTGGTEEIDIIEHKERLTDQELQQLIEQEN